MNLMLSVALAASKTIVEKHLGVAAAVMHQRIERDAVNLAAALQVEVAQAVEQLGQLSVRDLCLLFAEGPTEHTRALLLPERVHPHEHGGLDGHVQLQETEEPDNPANDGDEETKEESEK